MIGFGDAINLLGAVSGAVTGSDQDKPNDFAQRFPNAHAGPSHADDGSSEDVLRHFRWQHLPEHLAAVSRPFGELAQAIVSSLPSGRERTKALDHLLYAKDAAVRARLQ